MTNTTYKKRKYRTDYQGRMRLAFLRARAQATFRSEPWDLSYEEFQVFWRDPIRFSQKGFSRTSLVMTRLDPRVSWNKDNCVIITRLTQLRIQHARRANLPVDELFKDCIHYGH